MALEYQDACTEAEALMERMLLACDGEQPQVIFLAASRLLALVFNENGKTDEQVKVVMEGLARATEERVKITRAGLN